MMRRLMLTLTAAGLVGLAVGSAASLSFASSSVGAARQPVPRCTSAGLSVLQNLSASNVVSVTVGSLPASCGGATIQITLSNGSTDSSGSGSVPAGGGSVTVTLASTVAAATNERTDILITGP
jgi:hypothetical protein